MESFKARYTVRPTKRAVKLGEKLGITTKERLEIIQALKELRFWPDNKSEFTYEKAFGVLEFKFNTKDHWVRVFIAEDVIPKEMTVIYVMAKKTNKLTAADEIGVRTALMELENERSEQEKRAEKEKNRLTLINGGA